MKNRTLRQKRVIAVLSLVIAATVFALLGVFLWKAVMNDVKTPDDFKLYIDGFGWKGYLVAFGIQVLQVFVAFIPGEVVEIGAGLAFGWFWGLVVCLAGTAAASAAVFLLTKRFGIKLVEMFTDREKIDNMRFLNSEKKLKRLVFLLFFIPGTPKDLITYFVGLTRMTLSQFLPISLLARIPSVVSSTLAGHYFIEGDYLKGGIVFAATAAVSAVGMLAYNAIVKHRTAGKGAEQREK